MQNDIQWLIGIAVTAVMAVGGMLLGAFRSVSGKFANVHGRIDDVKEKYVRRDDLDGHIQRIYTNIQALKDETREGLADIKREQREYHKEMMDAIKRP